MFEFKTNSKGIALYMVLAVLLIVVIFGSIILNLIHNQSRLTHHQIKRIQAYYAAQAGITYALEAIRLNDYNWTATLNPITRIMCRNVTGVSPCTAVNLTPPNLTEPDLPLSINYVEIIISAFNPSYGNRINATANYNSD